MKKKGFQIGQRVYYTGKTTYGHKVRRSPGTIVMVSHCVHILLDDSRKPHEIKEWDKDTKTLKHTCIWVFPEPQRACVSIGDYVTGKKKIEIM